VSAASISGVQEATGSHRYRAFLSYSTAADGRLAPALQSALQRFAKPWYRIRAFRVFRDRTGLAVTPALWTSIETALRDSGFFILLASPGAAESRWVEQEVDWWLRHRSADRLLLVLTDGEIAWDTANGDFDWERTTALPRRLSHAFAQEPRFLDLRWARTGRELTLRHPTFADGVARLAATLRSMPLDDLIGEDIREHRKSLRLLAASMGVLAVLSVTAVVAALRGDKALRLAGHLASREQDAPRVKVRAAQSRQLADAALDELASNRDLAILLAAEAVRLHPSAEAESALRQALAGDPPPASLLPGHRERECYARFSPDGTRVLTWGDATGQILDAATGRPVVLLRGHTADILDARYSTDGRLVFTSSEDDSVRAWDAGTGNPLLNLQHAGATAALPAPHPERLLTLAPGTEAVLWNLATRERLASVPIPGVAHAGDRLASFHPEGGQLALCGSRGPVLLDTRDGRTLLSLEGHAGAVRSVHFNPAGNHLVTAGEDATARIWRVATGQCERILSQEGEAAALVEARFSPDNRWIAARTSRGTLVLWDAATGDRVARIEFDPGAEAPGLFTFSPSGACLVTASFDAPSADLWEPSTGRRLGRLLGDDGAVRTLDFGPDGRQVVVGSIFAPARVFVCDVCGSGDTLLAAAARRVPRELTPGERARFVAAERR